MHKPWTIRAGETRGTLDIRLYDFIGSDIFSEGTTAKNFAADLEAAGDVSEIRLLVNSPGGDCFEGLAIFNILLQHPARVTATVQGLAASISSVIICAASEISMAQNSLVMVHNPYSVAAGDAQEMRKLASVLDKMKASMVLAYQRHSDLGSSEIGAMMDAETWMTAAEAVDAGFAEVIVDPDEEDDPMELAANFDVSRFRHVPQQIAARLRARKEAPPAVSERERQRLKFELLRRL